MARAENITFEEFHTRFSTEEICRAELFRLRFPHGFVCPKCGCTEYYPFHGRNVFQCRACRHQTSVTAGIVMHRTHLPLTVWFWVIYLCATDKRGISAVQLSRTLGICYESAWYLLHRIRAAMGKRDEKYELSGIVEMDDGYVGGAARNGKRWSRDGQGEDCGGAVKNGKRGCAVHADAGRGRRHEQNTSASRRQSCCTGCKNRMRRLQKLSELVWRCAGRKKVRNRRFTLATQSHQQPESVSARHISRSLYTASVLFGRVLLPLQSPKNRRSDLHAPGKSRRCIMRPAALSR